MEILQGVIPVFLVVAVGALARRLDWMSPAFAKQLNRLIFYVAVPALLIRVLGTDRAGSLSLEVLAATVLATVLITVAGIGVAWTLRVPRERFGVLVQAAGRGNLVFMAFPVIFAAGGDAALRIAALLAAVLIPLQNILSVAVLGASTGRRGWNLVTSVVLNPIVLGVAAGLVWAGLEIDAPRFVDTFLELLGSIAMPGALLAVGAQLELADVRAWLGEVTAASILKLVVSPALCLAAMSVLGVDGTERFVGLLLLAAPTAVASAVVAQEMGGDVQYAGALVVASTLGAFPAFVAWGWIA